MSDILTEIVKYQVTEEEKRTRWLWQYSFFKIFENLSIK